jgi:tetratricopeptide (TPR) repeat protein
MRLRKLERLDAAAAGESGRKQPQSPTSANDLRAINELMRQAGAVGLSDERINEISREVDGLINDAAEATPIRFLSPEFDEQNPELAKKKLREALESYRVAEQFDLAVQAFESGRIYRAEALFRAVLRDPGLEAKGKPPGGVQLRDSPDARSCWLWIARCRERVGDYERALGAIDTAARFPREESDHGHALAFEELALRVQVLLAMGDTGAAVGQAKLAIDMSDRNWRESLEGDEVDSTIAVLASLPAEPTPESTRIRQAAAQRAAALRSFAQALAESDPDGSTEAFRSAIEISETLAKTDPIDAIRRSQIGGQAIGAAIARQAVPALLEAQMSVIGGRTATVEYRDEAEGCLGLAKVLLRRGAAADRVEAARVLARALVVARRYGHALQYEMETRFGNLLIEQGRTGDAVQFFLNGVEELNWRRRQLEGEELSRVSRISELRRVADPHEGHVRCVARAAADGDATAVLHAIRMARGVAFRELAARGGVDPTSMLLRQAVARGDEQLRGKVELAVEAREKALREALAIESELRDARISTEQKSDLFARLLAVQEDQLAATDEIMQLLRKTPLGIVPRRTQAAGLAEGECLLAYQFGALESWVVVSTAMETRCHRLRWPDGSPVTAPSVAERAVRLMRDYSDLDQPDPRSEALVRDDETSLGAALLPKEMLESLRASDLAIIVPDGPMVGFPFEALRIPMTEGQDSRWVEAGPATVYAAAPPLGQGWRTAWPVGGTPSLLAVGVGEFGGEGSADAGSNREILGFGALGPLPAAYLEVQSIKELWERRFPDGSVKILQGPHATHDSVVPLVRQPSVLHFATHGFSFGGARVGESCVRLAQKSADAPDRIRLRELLADWAGRLAGTRLVVLSACETAKGTVEIGEGTVSLTWGFLHAGAGNVLATRWSASDQGSYFLMRRFYENYLGEHQDQRRCGRETFGPGQPMPAPVALAEARRWIRRLTPADIGESSAAARTLTPREGVAFNRAATGGPFDHPWYWGLLEFTTRPD